MNRFMNTLLAMAIVLAGVLASRDAQAQSSPWLVAAPESTISQFDSETPVPKASFDIATAVVDLERRLAGFCFACSSCGFRRHRLSGSPPPMGGVVGFHPESCGEGYCSLHPSCGGGGDAMAHRDGEAIPATIASLAAAAPASLLTIAAALPQRVRINYDRRALQLIGCRNQVVASYSSALIPALREIVG